MTIMGHEGDVERALSRVVIERRRLLFAVANPFEPRGFSLMGPSFYY